MPSDNKIELRIERVEAKNRYGKRVRMQSENDLVLDEASNSRNFLNIGILHEHL